MDEASLAHGLTTPCMAHAIEVARNNPARRRKKRGFDESTWNDGLSQAVSRDNTLKQPATLSECP